MKQTIGSLINEILRKKGFSVTQFAAQIGCERNNVYNIIKKDDISIVQLRRISEVLKYNFFRDLADDPKLIQLCEQGEDIAVRQFLNVIDNVLNRLNITGTLCFGLSEQIKEEIPLPDYTLAPYFITFTTGESYKERANGQLDNIMRFKKHTKGNMFVTECINIVHKTQSIDIVIDYKTENGWEEIISFAFDIANEVYTDRTKALISELTEEH